MRFYFWFFEYEKMQSRRNRLHFLLFVGFVFSNKTWIWVVQRCDQNNSRLQVIVVVGVVYVLNSIIWYEVLVYDMDMKQLFSFHLASRLFRSSHSVDSGFFSFTKNKYKIHTCGFFAPQFIWRKIITCFWSLLPI